MKYSRAEVHSKAHKIPDLKFEQQSLTSFAGLIVFQQLFKALGFRGQLRGCCRHVKGRRVYGLATVFFQLIIHILLGYREIRDVAYYGHDPLVKRVLGLNQVPDPATVSRTFKDADEQSIHNLRGFLRDMIFERLKTLLLSRITLDFDGTVQSTGRFAEGTAVGFNKKKKGQRSYYPLFCTIAQTGQVLDFLHRPGNVHDSNGAKAFILACIQAVQQMAPGAQIEVRIDSALFSDAMVTALDKRLIQFTISVPFERWPKLKHLIEVRKRWWRHNRERSYFEIDWKPDKWSLRFRFIGVRTRVKKQRKEPVQLDLFIPHEQGYEFKVVVTNKTVTAPAIVAFHNGRGSQEGIFAELKSQCHMGHIPVRGLMGNQLYLLAGLFAHNLTRQLQMPTEPRSRGTTAKRAALWAFEQLDSLRHKLICRAGRITHPQGRLTLTISGGREVKDRVLRCLSALNHIPKPF